LTFYFRTFRIFNMLDILVNTIFVVICGKDMIVVFFHAMVA
jgi:hypothetical protein